MNNCKDGKTKISNVARPCKEYTILVKNTTPNPEERALTLRTQYLTGKAKQAVLPEDDEEKILEELRIRWENLMTWWKNC